MSFFRNEREGRIRAIWRLLLHGLLTCGLMYVAAFPLFYLIEPILPLSPQQPESGQSELFSPGLLLLMTLSGAIGALLSTWIACRWLDHRRLRDLGLRLSPQWWRELRFGTALGACLIVGILVVELIMGWAEITGSGLTDAGLAEFGVGLLVAIIALVAVGFYEELILRGYQMANIAESLNMPIWGAAGGVYVAFITTSLTFGLLHLGNPGASLMGVGNIAASGFLLMGLGYVLTGRLALPIGMHIGWNFAQAMIGLPVSGMLIGIPPLLITRVVGGDVWTGGAFGMEEGLLAAVATIAGCGILLAWVRAHTGRIAIDLRIAWPPMPRRRRAAAQPESLTQSSATSRP